MKLKRQTGIAHWNALCRLAFCVSLNEGTAPVYTNEKLEGGVEMSWKVFAGEYADVFDGLLHLRASKDGYGLDGDGLVRCLRAHVQRGLTHLASGSDVRTLMQFDDKWLNQAPAKSTP